MSVKKSVLQFLEEKKGTPVSGNEIAQALSVSRAAVWKAVHSLMDDGYPITSVTKKGYILDSASDMLSEQSIRPFLNDSSFYPEIQVHKVLESTNKTAKELANAGAPGGTVVIAEQQSGGRGRLGRSFCSPPGAGVYISILLRPSDSVETSMLVTSAAAVAVSRAIQKTCGLETQIKWVNDVYLDGKKLCGILTEASMNFENGALDYLVAGIGINLSSKDFPPELREIATSLKDHLGAGTPSRSCLAGAVLNEFQSVVNDLHEKSFLEEYRKRSFILGSEINIISPSGTTERSRAIDINEHGHLIVELTDGTQKALNSGEVSIRKILDGASEK